MNPTDSRTDDVIRLHGQMKADRGVWESHWQEVAERVLPRVSNFTRNTDPGGQKHSEKVFDSTAAVALPRFASAVESVLTPRTQTWHKLKAKDDALVRNSEVQRYLDEVNRRLFAARYSPRANFASQQYEAYISVGAFGTCALYIDEMLGYSLRYKSIHLAELFIMENGAGAIDRVHREFTLTARAAAQLYPDRLPESVKRASEREPNKLFNFLHCVAPREDLDYSKRDFRGMAFAATTICLDERAPVKESGYRTFPYSVGRYVTSPREVYGRSPAMEVLADIKTLNEQEKTILRAGQKAVDPPLLLADFDDGGLRGFNLQPGALNYGAVSSQGQQLVVPLQTGANFPLAFEMQEGKRKLINDAFLVSLFQILVDSPQMTATEAMLRAQEKGMLLAPTAGRLQSEMLGPMIEREIDLLSMAGNLPPMPDAMREAGGEFDIEYDSPIMRAQRAEQGIGIVRTIEALTPLAQIDPTVMKIINTERSARIIADVNGAPAEALNSPEEMEAIKDQDAQQAQAAALIQAAPAISGAAANLAKLQQTTGAAGALPA